MQLQEKEAVSVEACIPFKDKSRNTVTWINVDGLHQVELVENLCKYFEVHHLITEDILNTDQRPKIEEFEGISTLFSRCFAITARETNSSPSRSALSCVRILFYPFRKIPETTFA